MTYLIIPPYLIIAFFVMRAVLKKQLTRKRKWKMGVLTAFLLYLPLGWDVILGRAVFYGLCATQGGVHVYQTVELGAEYFDKDGSPKFINKGLLNESILNNKYNADIYKEIYFNKILSVKKIHTRIKESKSDKIIGKRVIFSYLGGWFSRYSGVFVRGEQCHSIKGAFYPDLVNAVFKKSKN